MFNPELPLQVFDTTTFAKTPPTPTPWVWDGYLAHGMVTLLTNRWKAGKTTLLSVLLNRLTTGESLAGAAVTPASPSVRTCAGRAARSSAVRR